VNKPLNPLRKLRARPSKPLSHAESIARYRIIIEAKNASERKIAKKYGVTGRDINRLKHGITPKRQDKRLALGLTALGEAPVCPTCRVVHVKKCSKETFADRLGKSGLITREEGVAINSIYESLKKIGDAPTGQVVK